MPNNNDKTAKYGESFVYEKLLENGIMAKWVSFSNRKSTADFITPDGKTIDVKCAYYSKGIQRTKGDNRYWRFNIHHHGKKQEGIDYYICVLKYNEPEPLVFIFPSDIFRSFDITITSKMLERGKYDHFLNNWDLIK
ncbi:MAG TPA: hypothetical protein ENH82_05240 [bacterium]|nr:hypothetical protein [bacterium]